MYFLTNTSQDLGMMGDDFLDFQCLTTEYGLAKEFMTKVEN
jgi:hypothetical protein